MSQSGSKPIRSRKAAGDEVDGGYEMRRLTNVVTGSLWIDDSRYDCESTASISGNGLFGPIKNFPNFFIFYTSIQLGTVSERI